MVATSAQIRTRVGDQLSDYELQVWRPKKLAVVVKDKSGSKRAYVPGTVLVRGLYEDSVYREGFDGFEEGAYSAREGLEGSGVTMLLTRGLLGDVRDLVHQRVLTAVHDSRLDDRHWGFRTKPLEEVLRRLVTTRERLRNEHVRQLEAILRSIVTRRDQRERRNPGAVSAKLRSARVPQLIKSRVHELDGTRAAALERAQDVDHLIEHHVRLFADLCGLVGAALFREQPVVGALKEPSHEQLCKLVINLNKLLPELGAVVAKPFEQVAALCLRDCSSLIELVTSMTAPWNRSDAGFVEARRLGFKLYTAARAVKVNDEVQRELGMVARNIPYGDAPAITIDAVHAACDTVASWVELVPDDVNYALDYPFKNATRDAIRDARDAADVVRGGAAPGVPGLKRLKAALGRASHALMYGETRAA